MSGVGVGRLRHEEEDREASFDTIGLFYVSLCLFYVMRLSLYC